MSSPAERPPGQRRGWVGGSQDFAAGLFLLFIAALSVLGSLGLAYSQGTGVGPGMMPRSVALLVGAFGLLFVVQALLSQGAAMERWSLRGPFFVLGAALVFAWTIRPLGVAVAGPLTVLIASMADKDTRLVEIVPYAFILTLACIALFSYGLRLPMPVWPTAAPYPLDQWL
jgi:putative tricarboxylic transport membrane protein